MSREKYVWVSENKEVQLTLPLAPSLLIALATSSKQLCVIRAGIDWGISPNNEKPKGIPNSFNATLRIRPLAVTSWLHDVPGNTVNASHLESSMVQLSHLEFLPPCADSTNQMSPPILMAIRSYLPGSTSHYNQEVYSTVDRWEFRDRTQPVHTAFENLSSRKSADGSHPSKPVVGKIPHLLEFMLTLVGCCSTQEA